MVERIDEVISELSNVISEDIPFLLKSKRIGDLALVLRGEARSLGLSWDKFLKAYEIPISRAYLYNSMSIAASWEQVEAANNVKPFESLREVLAFVYPQSKMMDKLRALYLREAAEGDLLYSTGL